MNAEPEELFVQLHSENRLLYGVFVAQATHPIPH
jgi:hypothetical protein